MDVGYILFWTVFSTLLGILYYRFVVINMSLKAKVKQGLSKISEHLKIQISRIVSIVRGVPGKISQHIPLIQSNIVKINANLKSRLMPRWEWLKNRLGGIMNFLNFRTAFNNTRWKFIVEWAIIAIWALWIGRAYLDTGMGLDMWPSSGQEYIMAMQNQYVWTLLPKCGVCFFWNGFTNGGAPSFIDLHSAWLHPISIVATFLFGVFNSGKIMVIASLFMAGIAQWWLGKILKFGTVTRLWTALVIVASGALSGRMQIGSLPLILSTAACCLVFPPALQLALSGGRKAAIALGIALGLAALAGQGYLQIGLLISLIPMLLVLLTETTPNGVLSVKSKWRYFLFAIILGGLIAAPLILPVAHFLSNLGKDTDPTFASGQALEFSVLNLVINNVGFYSLDTLGKQPFGYLYINYIGWIPVIFAILGLVYAPQKYRKTIFGISLAICFVYLTSSAVLLKWINLIPVGDFATGIRNPGPIQGLAAPLVLALAGIGAEALIKKEWPQFSFTTFQTDQKSGITTRIDIKWIVILIAMAYALYSVSEFSKNWLYVEKINVNTSALRQSLKTPDAQWVQPPYGEYAWLPGAIENGMKIRDFFRPWRVTVAAEKELPGAYLQMSNIKEDANLPEYFKTVDSYVVLKRPNSLYASINNGKSIDACKATSIGGSVDVACDTTQPGTLTVYELALSGWTVARDGQTTALISDAWLTVDAPAGKHNYAFRYLPWDAPLGIGLAILGWVVVIVGLLYFPKKTENQPVETGQDDL